MMLMRDPLPTLMSQRRVCDVLNINRNTLRSLQKKYQFCGPVKPIKRKRKQAEHPRALTETERQEVKAVLTSDDYYNQPPMQVYYALLEQGRYLCSVSTMHRLLREENMQGERRAQRQPQSHAIPRLVATRANEVWTWDITKLATKKRGEYLSLYVVMDLFSRYIVAWMLSRKENSALASQLIQEAVDRYRIDADSLTLHQDRGAPMTAHCYLDLLSDLAVTPSHSRPRVSNDNAFSEAQFKTLKYQPDYPQRFDHYDHAQSWCQDYVTWFNTSHHHVNLAGFTPDQVFTGEYIHLATIRQKALDEAYQTHPERFIKGSPTVKMPSKIVCINPIPDDADLVTLEKGVNFPTLSRAKRNAN